MFSHGIRNRLGLPALAFAQIMICFLPGAVTANEEEQRLIIENAINMSRLTGRPILAVAGSNT